MKRIIKAIIGVPVAGTLVFGLAACGEDQSFSVASGFCGFLQGKGGRDNHGNANSAGITQILYAGQSVDYKTDQAESKVFPCVTRNYVVAPQGQSADTNQPLTAITQGDNGQPGVPVYVYVSMYWQPNQSNRSDQGNPIRQFIEFAQGKYGAAAGSPSAFNGDGVQNASTPGWNKMLAENVYPALQRSLDGPMRQVGNAIWQVNDPALRKTVGDAMSDAFIKEFQQTTGSTADLICGSGSTGAGEKFNCEPVRIVVDAVYAQDGNTQSAATQNAAQQAQQRLADQTKSDDIRITNDLYGPVLGPQFRACRDANKAAAGSCKLFPGAAVQVQAPA